MRLPAHNTPSLPGRSVCVHELLGGDEAKRQKELLVLAIEKQTVGAVRACRHRGCVYSFNGPTKRSGPRLWRKTSQSSSIAEVLVSESSPVRGNIDPAVEQTCTPPIIRTQWDRRGFSYGQPQRRLLRLKRARRFDHRSSRVVGEFHQKDAISDSLAPVKAPAPQSRITSSPQQIRVGPARQPRANTGRGEFGTRYEVTKHGAAACALQRVSVVLVQGAESVLPCLRRRPLSKINLLKSVSQGASSATSTNSLDPGSWSPLSKPFIGKLPLHRGKVRGGIAKYGGLPPAYCLRRAAHEYSYCLPTTRNRHVPNLKIPPRKVQLPATPGRQKGAAPPQGLIQPVTGVKRTWSRPSNHLLAFPLFPRPPSFPPTANHSSSASAFLHSNCRKPRVQKKSTQ